MLDLSVRLLKIPWARAALNPNSFMDLGYAYPSQEKYGIGEEKLRIFIHYQPTYYHFHVHFVHTSHVGMGIAAGQAHLLDDVIGEGCAWATV